MLNHKENCNATEIGWFQRIFFILLIACTILAGCRLQTVAVPGDAPNYWEQKVYGDSLSVFPHILIIDDVYPFGMKFQPLDELAFLPHAVIDNYWKSKHLLSFGDAGNHLVFEEFGNGPMYRYPLVYASITDKRILLEEGIRIGLSRKKVLRRLKLDGISDNIHKVCVTTNRDASETFYFVDGLLSKIVIRTDRELLHNPDPVFEYRHAGQVKGYTGKRLYAVLQEPEKWLSTVCYTDEKGDTIVPYGRYSYCVSDSIAPVGFVLEAGVNGITCINTEGKPLCRALVVDNFTPDYLSEGTFRIVNDEGLMGFADSLGLVVIAPQFKYAYPFQDGRAKVTYTGHKNNPNDEHWEWVSDDWFYIDHQGHKVIDSHGNNERQ